MQSIGNSAMDSAANFDISDQSRSAQRTQFQEVEETKEYCETQYMGNLHPRNYRNLVTPGAFWADVAGEFANGKSQLTISPHFIHATRNLTEMVGVLSLLDLPFQSAEQEYQAQEGRRIAIKGKSNYILFRKEVKEAEIAMKNDLLVIHRFFDNTNRNSETEIKEFLVDEVYGCEVIITNVSNSAKNFSILWQIPEGSLPLGLTSYQKSVPYTLASFTTMKFDFKFYFPNVPAEGYVTIYSF